MKIIASGIIDPVKSGATQRIRTFPALTSLSNGELLLTCRAGSEKVSDDGTILIFRSSDRGQTWTGPETLFAPMRVEGILGSFMNGYLTELEPGHLIAACLWVDRETHPGQPLFNEHSGCLPMAVLLSDSHDFGRTWSTPRKARLAPELGPPSLTNPILKLPGGILAMSIESNKEYADKSKWFQKVVLCHSSDGGQTWGEPVISGFDPSGRIFNWDQREAVGPDGTIGAFTWTFDNDTQKYLNMHRRVSRNGGKAWSAPEDLGFADQAGHPAVLPDGRVVLAWVDRFGTVTIRARMADSIAGKFDASTEVEIYRHNQRAAHTAATGGETLAEMGLWTFGLPYAEAVGSQEALVVYYTGDSRTMNIGWARLAV